MFKIWVIFPKVPVVREEDHEKDMKGKGTTEVKDEVEGWKVARGRRGKGC